MSNRLSGAILFYALAAAPAVAAQGVTPIVSAPAARTGETRFQGPQRVAIERCAPRIERYGRFQVDDVRRDGRAGWRVRGTVSDGGAGLGYGYGLRRGYGHRTFTCTVAEDGRIRLKTARIRRY